MASRIWPALFRFPLVVALASTLSAIAPARAGTHHGWRPAGTLLAPVSGGNAFALSDGRVVSVGIADPSGVWPATTQSWTLSSNGWTPAASTPALPNLVQGVPVMLDDGRILVTGYCAHDCEGGENTELYDPATDKWSMPGQMSVGRYRHTAVKLADGRVLVLGGCPNESCYDKEISAEIFDPATQRFSPAAPMHARRIDSTATLLADGRVLVAGGAALMGVMWENETYDPATNTWTVNAPMKKPHASHVAVLLGDGRVLVAGGACANAKPCDAVEIFNPLNGRWKSMHHLDVPREYAAAVRLQDGTVLIAGGLSCWGNLWRYMETTEIFDPATNNFAHGKPMAAQRGDFALAMLRDGRVLAAGGDSWVYGTPPWPGDAELLTP